MLIPHEGSFARAMPPSQYQTEYLNMDHTVCVNLFIGWSFTASRKQIGSVVLMRLFFAPIKVRIFVRTARTYGAGGAGVRGRGRVKLCKLVHKQSGSVAD